MVAEFTSVEQTSPSGAARPEARGEELSLAELRAELQQIDAELLRLFAERQRLARRAGAMKWRRGWPLYDPEQAVRHLELLLQEGARRQLPREEVRALYRTLHRAALNEQRSLTRSEHPTRAVSFGEEEIPMKRGGGDDAAR